MFASAGADEVRVSARPSAGPPAGGATLRWILSLAFGALLLWFASRKLELWPTQLQLVHVGWLVAACGMQLPYAWLRAVRLGPLLDESVAHARPEAREAEAPISRRLLLGSGFVSFFMVMLVPLRIGEAARPLILGRARVPGLTVASSAGLVGLERLVDGLCVVAMLFVGLASLDPSQLQVLAETEAGAPSTSLLAVWRRSGWIGGGLFAGLLLMVFWISRDPSRPARWGAWWVARASWLSSPVGFAVRVFDGLAPVWTAGARGGRFVLVSGVYWAVTVVQLWMVMRGCGIEGDLGHAVLVVAVVGLSLQLPSGPAQVGSFQLGMAWAVSLLVGVPGASTGQDTFAALMYALSLGGAAVMAAVGAILLRTARDSP